MRKLISPSVMRDCEQAFFRTGCVPSIEVMERAARALADAIMNRIPRGKRIYFACGTGGNGGDGTACARMLCKEYDCIICQVKPPTTADAIENLRRAHECGIAVCSVEGLDGLRTPDVWVDALFGTGLSRAPSGDAAKLIHRINADHEKGTFVVAADIPSGLNGQTGVAYDPCIHADLTVIFQFAKTGQFLADGLDHCGELRIADVEFPEAEFGPFDALLLDSADLVVHLPMRPRNMHKGNCGHLLIVAGSFGMAGAAALCAMAALRSGAGLISVACPRSIVSILQTLVPGAMCIPLEECDGAISSAAIPELQQALNGKDAVVIGCGLSRRASPEIVQTVLESGIPAVLDADALNLLSEHPELYALLQSHHVLTPHPGEAKRLLESFVKDATSRNALLRDPIAAVHALSQLPLGYGAEDRPTTQSGVRSATVLYKGAACTISDNRETYISASGCCGMARGGSGDILSGIIGALLAEDAHRSPALSAAIASELHGLAGERAQTKYGSRAMNARDILEFLPNVFPRHGERSGDAVP